MRAKLGLVVACAGLLLGVAQVRAHHAFAAEFDVNKPLTLKGSLVKWEMVNPHSWFHIDVKDADGKTTEWLIEGGSPNQLIRMGVTKNTVPIGTELTIEGYRAKDGGLKAVGRNFVLAGRLATVPRRLGAWRQPRQEVARLFIDCVGRVLLLQTRLVTTFRLSLRGGCADNAMSGESAR